MDARLVAVEYSVETKEIVLSDLLRWVVYAESEVAAVSVVVGTQPNVIRFDKTNLHNFLRETIHKYMEYMCY